MTKLDVSVEEGYADRVVMALGGELDISNCAQAERELERLTTLGCTLIVVDLRRLAFMDSTGLRFIVTADERLRESGKRLVLVRGPERVQRVFQITDVEPRMSFVTDPEEPVAPGGPRHQIDLHLPADPAVVATARHALRDLSSHMSSAEYDNVELALSELVTNSIRHAGLGPRQEISVKVVVTDAVVRLEVSDPGTGFRPEARAEAADPGGGWGLFIVDRVADRWDVAIGDHTTVWLEIDRGWQTAQQA